MQNTRVVAPVDLADAFRHFPAPALLVDAAGHILLPNEGFSLRFGRATFTPGSLAEAARRATERSGQWSDADIATTQGPSLSARVFGLRRGCLFVFEGAPGTEVPTRPELEALRARVARLEHDSATDHLTGAWNRAHFDRVISAELATASETRRPISLLLIDVDHFKRVNDHFGHATGDSVLRELVALVRGRIRASDVLFRWGGEEFAVLVSGAGHRRATRAAENLRAAVEAHTFETVGALTVSIGVAEALVDAEPAAWFARMDAALYAAKNAGRNRVVVDPEGSSDVWAGTGAATSLRLEWQEGLESGEPTIDAEHRELLRLGNVLIEAALASTAPEAATLPALDALLDQVRQHFADEEAILAEHGYLQLAGHKRNHASLLRRAGVLRERCARGRAHLGAIVEFLVQDVVARHLMTVDRAFFPLFEDRASRP